MHNPTEHVQEHLTHEAAHGGHDDHGGHASKWITAAALTAAILAAFAAITGFLATNHLTQSTLIRIQANDNWNYYQAKSIKSSILDAKIYIATVNKMPPRSKDTDKLAQYGDDLPKLQKDTWDLEDLSDLHLETHETFEMAATMFHIAIAVVAIAVVAKRREFWYMSIVGGVIGLGFFGYAYAHAPPNQKKEPHTVTSSAAATEGKAAGEAGSATKEGAKPAAEKGAAAPNKEAAPTEGGEKPAEMGAAGNPADHAAVH